MARRNRGYMVGGSHWVGDSAFAKKLARKYADETRLPVTVRPVDERGYAGRVVYTARPVVLKKNPSARSFEARATRAIRKGEKFLVSLPARLRGKRRKR